MRLLRRKNNKNNIYNDEMKWNSFAGTLDKLACISTIKN